MVKAPRPIPDAVRATQARASDPAASTFVSANAGSGKTHMLVQRVIRLLLAGVRLRLLLFRGKRRRGYHEAARWLSSGKAGSLLRSR